MGRTIIDFRADTRMARLFIAIVSIPALLGWRWTEATANRLADHAAGLITVKEVRPSWKRLVIPLPPKDGWRRYVGGPRYLALTRGRPAK